MELRKFIKTTIREYLNEQQNVENNLNANFNKWFGSSVMIENNKPIIFYHGSTDNELNIFKEKSFRYNGIYLTRKTNYAKQFGSNLLSLYASIKKTIYYSYGRNKLWN